MGRPTLLANAGIETPPVITNDVIRPVSTMRVAVFIHFFFFVFLPAACETQFHQANMPQSQLIFLTDMLVILVGVP